MNKLFLTPALISGPQTIKEPEVPAFVARLVRDVFVPGSIILLEGPLGAGKSSFVRLLAKELGVRESITSPTFGYVNQYALPNGGFLAHFDLYRLSTINSFFDAGFDEMVIQSTYSAIEWPGVSAPFIQSVSKRPVFLLNFEYSNQPDERVITVYRRP